MTGSAEHRRPATRIARTAVLLVVVFGSLPLAPVSAAQASGGAGAAPAAGMPDRAVPPPAIAPPPPAAPPPAAETAPAVETPDRAVPAPAAVVPVGPVGAVPGGQPVQAPVRTDRIRREQWQLDTFQATDIWQISTGRDVTVAVIDSGVDGSHPDLSGQVLPGIDLVNRGGNGWSDPVGHGTTVAGLIAGRTDDSRGVAGLAPGARILPVRVLDEENRYDDALIVAKGVRWAVDNGARVVNLSLGGTGDSLALAAALDYAFARDVVVVACTGNVLDGATRRVWYPAREPGVIAVTGSDGGTDQLWTGAITGAQTVLTAPATGLTGARPGGFWRVQGTSFAAPLVSAAAALIRARWPEMSAAEVVNRLTTTARDLGPAGRDDRFGFGMVNPVAALRETVPPVSRNPLDDGLSPGRASFGRAPGLPTPSGQASGSPAQEGGPATRAPTPRWAARPAGATTGDRSGTYLWGGAVLLVLLVAAGTIVRRRT